MTGRPSGPVLFLIPARGGSRRVPNKGLREVAGIPLVSRAARIARAAAAGLAGGPHRVVCTTDDPAIAAAAQAWGAEVPFMRSAALATDTATSVDVALDALDRLEADGTRFRALALVQPTSPLTAPADLRAAIEQFDALGGPGVVSVTASHPAGWHGTLAAGRGGDGPFEPIDGADGPDILSGAFYVITPADLRRSGRFVEPGRTVGWRVASERSVDVDEELDLAVAEALAAAPIRRFEVAGRTIGDGRVFILAEAGVNHDGDPAIAHRLVDAAADAGADAVKFQTFDPAALATADAPLADYQRQAGETTDQRGMLARLALPDDAWPALQAHAAERGIVFLSSPFDDAAADLLDRLDVPAFKVGSGELTNLPFLARLARRGRPLLVSTGMADLVEVAAALDAIAAAGDPPVALFHCVSAYPADPADANLGAMATLRRAFGTPTGWSDHSLGIELPTAAAALGADLIEKHLTLDRSRSGPDHRASLEPDEFRAMVAAIRTVTNALGTGRKTPAAAERDVARVARRSLYWRRSLAAGAPIGEDDLVALRPAAGMPPGRASGLVGRRLASAVEAGALVRDEDLEP